jgi:Zn-dependent protease with chaperone function
MLSWCVRLLLWLYIPFLLGLCALMVWLLRLLALGINNFTCVIVIALPVGFLLLVTLYQVFVSLANVLRRPAEDHGFEVRLPTSELEPVFRLVAEIARKQSLRMPQEIRIAADTVAHVYEERNGKRVLVLGGMAIAAFTQETLAGVIAHELAHFTAGDTRLSRQASRFWRVGACLEVQIHERPESNLNPLVWLIRLYHRLFVLVWAAHSRQQEFAADGHQVQHAGKEAAATSLLFTTVTQRLPWARLSNIAKSHVATNEPIDQLFSEQMYRAQTTPPYEWEEACRGALKVKTEFRDTHPCLKERLKAMGVTTKQALKLIQKQKGPPARDLFPAWTDIEKLLTNQLIALYREEYQLKREMAQIILGRPP